MFKKLRRIVAFLLAFVLLLEPGVRALADGEQNDGIVEEPAREVVFTTDDVTIRHFVTAIWDGGYNATLMIENTGSAEIRNWYLTFENSAEFESISNAEVISNENGVCTLKNAGWNANVKPGESASIFYTVREEFAGFAGEYHLVGDHALMKDDDFEVHFLLDNVWEDGFTGYISIRNLNDSPMEDWSVEFDYANEFTTVWNGVITYAQDQHYVISNADYNANIAGGEAVTIGFLVNGGDSQATIGNVKVRKHVLEVPAEQGQEQDPGSDEVPQDEDNYIKDFTEDDLAYDEYGLTYVKNQLLVMTYLGTDKKIVEKIATEMGAQIVGYIKNLCTYQLEFTEDKTCEELEEYMELFYVYPFVMFVDLNYVSDDFGDDFRSNDTIYNDGQTCKNIWTDSNGDNIVDYGEKSVAMGAPADVWDVNKPDGDNRGLEAINAPGAWDFLGSFPEADKVKVGVIDSSFGSNPDLTNQFAAKYNNPATITSDHGTHVSGTIGAEFNNDYGVSGVATNVELYGYSIENVNSAVKRRQMFNQLIIEDGVKVINISQGYLDEISYSATWAANDTDKARQLVKKETKDVESTLKMILMAGYDFLIVQSAGNGNNGAYVASTNSNGYAYEKYDSSIHTGSVTTESRGVDAKYNFWDTSISNEAVASHIMIVGSARIDNSGAKTKYPVSDFSNQGTVVDVYAPGEDILSTVNALNAQPFLMMGGTSMAAPHITGLAALMWQADPDLTSAQVKQIIMASQGHPVLDSSGSQLTAGSKTYYIPDSAQCVEDVLNHYGVAWTHSELPSGYVNGIVASDADSSPLANIDVMFIRTSTGQSNLDDYWFTAKTDTNGEFNILLPQGTYEVIVSDPYWNYVPFSIKNVQVNPDETRYLEKIYLYPSDIYFICGDGQILGSVYNALDGSVISGAEVVVRSGWNTIEGPNALEVDCFGERVITDDHGNFDVTLPIGQYTLEISKEGYVIGYYNVFSRSDDDVSRLYYVLNPVMGEGEYRIVLTWKSTPRDLDSHLLYYASGASDPSMHVYYSNAVGNVGGVKVAALDLDDTNGYGPETVTLTVNSGALTGNAKFKYCVHDYTNRSYGSTSKEMSYSGAVVQVYYGNAVVETYRVNENVIGNVWEVFEINCDGLKALNYYKNQSSASNVR